MAMDKIDVVYTLGIGSEWDNNELRYSLRSLEKNLMNYGNVFIVGECPGWIKNVIHIPATDMYHPSRNIMEKIMLACKDNRLTNEFMFWNDDFFLTQPTNAIKYPYYYDGVLEAQINPLAHNWYQEYLKETVSELLADNNTTLNFDIHTPIVYDKVWFKSLMRLYDFDKKLLIKSIYCNALEVAGEYMPDVKLRGEPRPNEIDRMINNNHIFSTGDWCLRSGYVKQRLQQLFPNPSKYEI